MASDDELLYVATNPTDTYGDKRDPDDIVRSCDRIDLADLRRLLDDKDRLRSELEQVKRERDALAATVEALREAAGRVLRVVGRCHVGVIQRDHCVEHDHPMPCPFGVLRAARISAAFPRAHLSERDARVRGEAIEEAARVCEARAESYARYPGTDNGAYEMSAEACAEAIRSLATGGDHEDRE